MSKHVHSSLSNYQESIVQLIQFKYIGSSAFDQKEKDKLLQVFNNAFSRNKSHSIIFTITRYQELVSRHDNKKLKCLKIFSI